MFLAFLKNVYLFFKREREKRERASGGGTESEGDRGSKQAPGSVQTAENPTQGLNP